MSELVCSLKVQNPGGSVVGDEPLIKVDFAGDWSKPADTLIKKCSDAIAGLARPTQIVRLARAEAEAEEIRALSRIKITGIERRATERFLAEEVKKQENMESIVRKALPNLKQDAEPDKVEDDWITHFFDRCRLISDQQMQTLWANILAEESNNPGKFSKRTINVVGNLDKIDAQLFEHLCSFIVNWSGDPQVIVTDFHASIYMNRQVNFGTLAHLDDIGLVSFGNMGFSKVDFRCPVALDYFGESFTLSFTPPIAAKTIPIGYTLFTMAGGQLSKICKVQPQSGFVEHLREYWKRHSLTLDGPLQ